MKTTKPQDIIFNIAPAGDVNPWRQKWKTVFTSATGDVKIVPGFYDGGDRWITRFSATEAGDWTYVTFSSWEALNGLTGSLSVKEEQLTERGIMINPRVPNRLTWADGKDYFLLGFECDWLALLDLEEEEIPKAEKIMDAMEKNGFNHVVMNVYARDTEWPWVEGRRGEHDYADPPLWPFGGTWDNPDYTQLNPDFFKNFDKVMEGLQSRSIIAHLMIYVWNKKVPWPALGSAEDDAYFDYLLARYQAYTNLVWDISKEALLYGDCTDEFITERCRRTKKADAYGHLITVHDRGYCERHPEEVDILSTQTWSGDLFNNMRSLAQSHPGKPVYNIEHGGYERSPYNVFPGDYDNPEICLDRNYQCLFAGVYSTHYWQGCSWNIVIPELESLPEKDRPKLEYYRRMADFFSHHPFTDYSVPKHGMGSSGLWLTHNRDNQLLLYKPPGHCACHRGNGPGSPFKGKLPSQVVWFNTITGEFQRDSHFKPAHDNEGHDKNMGQWLEFKSPWGEGPAIALIEW